AKGLMQSPSIVRKGLIWRLTGDESNGKPWRHHVWDDLEVFLQHSRTGQTVRLPGGWEMLRDRGRFLLRHGESPPEGVHRVLNIGRGRKTTVRVGPFEFTLAPTSHPGPFVRDPSVEYVDHSLLAGTKIVLREWQAGDRMKPLGLSGFKKVSDILVDEKMDRFTKESQIVLTVDGKIAWLCGIRLDDRFKVSPDTSHAARLTCVPWPREERIGMKQILTEKQIRTRVKELAEEISRDFRDKVPIFIGVLNGCFVFMADLVRELTLDCEVDFIKLSSYDGDDSSGTVHLLKDISADVTGRDVVVVEDVVDSGLTVEFLRTRLKGAGPSSVTFVTLLFKKEVARLNFDLDYVGFQIPADFVVGYGLDHNQRWRNLGGIYRLEDENVRGKEVSD
ncbi:MAG: hypoxanthine phosphoribosyltransferase, partial [Fidelibacterota bacterium]